MMWIGWIPRIPEKWKIIKNMMWIWNSWYNHQTSPSGSNLEFFRRLRGLQDEKKEIENIWKPLRLENTDCFCMNYVPVSIAFNCARRNRLTNSMIGLFDTHKRIQIRHTTNMRRQNCLVMNDLPIARKTHKGCWSHSARRQRQMA